VLNDNYLTLAEIIRSQGFTTACFIQIGNAGPYAGLHHGFATLFDASTMGEKAEPIYGKELYGWLKSNAYINFFL
jgi:hypothetical protein